MAIWPITLVLQFQTCAALYFRPPNAFQRGGCPQGARCAWLELSRQPTCSWRLELSSGLSQADPQGWRSVRLITELGEILVAPTADGARVD